MPGRDTRNQNFLNLIGQTSLGYPVDGQFHFNDHVTTGALAAVANQMAQNYVQSDHSIQPINFNQSENDKDSSDYASSSADSGNTRYVTTQGRQQWPFL